MIRTGIAELDADLDRLDQAVDRSNAEKDALRAALRGLLEHLPELWGDLIRSGDIVLRISADAVDAAQALLGKDGSR